MVFHAYGLLSEVNGWLSEVAFCLVLDSLRNLFWWQKRSPGEILLKHIFGALGGVLLSIYLCRLKLETLTLRSEPPWAKISKNNTLGIGCKLDKQTCPLPFCKTQKTVIIGNDLLQQPISLEKRKRISSARLAPRLVLPSPDRQCLQSGAFQRLKHLLADHILA